MSMIRKVVDAAGSAAMRAQLKRGGLVCPDCGAEESQLPEKRDSIIECRSCGTRASLAEWISASQSVMPRGSVGEPPQDTRITLSEDGVGGKSWDIPPGSKFNFFTFFSAVWLAITAIVSGGFLLVFLTGGEIEGDMPGWVMIPFFGIFWAVGLGTLYFGLRQGFAKHRITVAGGQLTMRRELFGRVSEKSLSCGSISSIKQREFYQQNNRPVYGIEIRGTDGKIRFGSSLKDEEKAWLVAEFTDAALPKPSQTASAPSSSADGRATLAPIQLRSTASGQPFSHVIPGMGIQQFWAGVVFTIISGLFVAVAFTFMRDESWIGFRGIWTLLSTVFLGVGLGMLVQFLMKRGKEQRIEGTDSEISIRTYRRGLILKDQSFPRRDVSDIRASSSGNSGGTPMKRVDLIVGDRAVKLAGWIDGDEADDLVRNVRDALGR